MRAERWVEVVVPREEVGEIAVWIGGPTRHTVVMWVEVAVRAIARGHDQVMLAVVVVVVEMLVVVVLVVVMVVVQGQQSGEEAEAKGVSNKAGVVEEAAREAAAGVGIEAEVGVEVHRMGVVLGVVEVVEAPT